MIDLHMHSYYSDDGEFQPEELVQKCKEKGIRYMAIADHNCVRAVEEGRKAAQKEGIHFISGVEIDCTFQGVNLHVLGYGIDERDPAFQKIEDNISEQSGEASVKMLEGTRKLGFDVSEKDMEELTETMFWKNRWTGEMFAEVLLNKPEYKEHELLLPYRPGGNRSSNPYVNFYWDYYSQGKPCHVGIKFPSMEEVIAKIHESGGKAVLAHPGVNLKDHMELWKEIAVSGIDGVEAFSSYHSPEDAMFFSHEAGKYGLFVTCGSDYHGKTKPSICIGQHGCSHPEDEILPQLESIVK